MGTDELKDNEQVYDEQIAPLMTQIIAICKEHGIPLAATFEYAPEMYCTTTLPHAAQSEHMRRVNILVADGAPPTRPSFQITTTKADGSKILEVILP